MKACESKPRKAIAAIIDFYYLAIAVGFVVSMIVSLARVNVIRPLHAMLFILLDLIIVVVYHTAVSLNVGVMTLGEIIAGRIRENGRKIWTNPYCKNRSGIIGFIFACLIIYENSFDTVFAGSVPSTTGTMFTGVRIALVTVGFILVGKGRTGGIFIPTAIMLLGGLLSMIQRSVSGLAAITMATSFVFGLAGVVIWLIYRRPRGKSAEESASMGGGE